MNELAIDRETLIKTPLVFFELLHRAEMELMLLKNQDIEVSTLQNYTSGVIRKVKQIRELAEEIEINTKNSIDFVSEEVPEKSKENEFIDSINLAEKIIIATEKKLVELISDANIEIPDEIVKDKISRLHIYVGNLQSRIDNYKKFRSLISETRDRRNIASEEKSKMQKKYPKWTKAIN